MSEIDTERIKLKFYTKLKEEEKVKNKKTKLTSIILVAVIAGLTGVTVFAANLGVFNTLFSNFNDVSKKLQPANVSDESNGITMTLSGYLADTKGIVPELVFTKNDGSTFAPDTAAVRAYDNPSIKINNIVRLVSPKNIVSGDGKTYYCLPIIHYDIENIIDSTLEISVNKLVYNVNKENKTMNLDLYDVFKKAEVKTMDNVGPHSDLIKLFDSIKDNPIQSEIGISIDAIVFAKVKESPSDTVAPDIAGTMPPADGIDLGGLYTDRYNNIVAIKYTITTDKDDKEYNFDPVNLTNNKDPFGIGIGIGGNTQYYFFRVDDFEDLKNMNGIDFIVNSNNFISGDWYIKTKFASNQNLSTVDINKTFAIEDLNTTLTLAKANISLLSTKLSYEIKDSEGTLLTDITGYDMNVYYLKCIFGNEIKLRYSDGSEISLIDSSFYGGLDGVLNVSYDVEMNHGSYTLMNTNKLSAIVVNGESFVIN